MEFVGADGTLLAMNRRDFLVGAAATATSLSLPNLSPAEQADLQPIWKEIEKRHDESVKRLQTWIRQPSIAAENRGMNEGCDLTMQLLYEAGFQSVTKIPTNGQPGIFATLDAGAPRTLGLYFMYDVKQADPAEWSSPPWDAALVDKPGFGKAIVGRGAVNQKGPQAAVLAGMIQSPETYDPIDHPKRAVNRRNEVLDRMASFAVHVRGGDWTGFTGRRGIYELMVITEDIREMVYLKETAGAIKNPAVRRSPMVFALGGRRKTGSLIMDRPFVG